MILFTQKASGGWWTLNQRIRTGDKSEHRESGGWKMGSHSKQKKRKKRNTQLHSAERNCSLNEPLSEFSNPWVLPTGGLAFDGWASLTDVYKQEKPWQPGEESPSEGLCVRGLDPAPVVKWKETQTQTLRSTKLFICWTTQAFKWRWAPWVAVMLSRAQLPRATP